MSSTGSSPVPANLKVKGGKYKGDKICLCANPDECRGLTAAFAILKDGRKGFVKLPNWREEPESQYYVERNLQRECYLRHLLPGHPVQEPTSTKNIALHHFHPKVTRRFLDKRQKEIPKTITEEEMTHLGIPANDRDRVIDEFGFPTGECIFVPNYPVPKVKEDLKRMILINRIVNEAIEEEEERRQQQAREEAAERERQEDDEERQAPVGPSPLETLKDAPDTEKRRMLYIELKTWEMQRRGDHEILLESTISTWRGSCDFLEDAVREIARAERLVLGAALADKAFSEAMDAIAHDSYLDDEHNAVSEAWKQNRLMASRQDQWMPTEMMHPLVEAKTRLGDKFGEGAEYGTGEIGSELTVFREEMEMEVAGIKEMGDYLLIEMEISEKEVQNAWAAVYSIANGEPVQDHSGVSPSASHHSAEKDSAEEDAEEGVTEAEDADKESADKPVSSLMEESPDDISTLSGHGDEDTVHSETPKEGEDVLAKLTEDATPASRRGFGFFKKLSERSISTGSAPLAAVASPLASAAAPLASVMDWSSPVSSSLRKLSTVKDVWVRESLYRAAVQHQAKVWQTCLGLLSKMNDAMKEIEMERSVKLHAMLLDFLPRERRMFMGLPAVPQPVMEKLVALREDQSKMEENIDESLHKRSRIVLRIDNDQRSSIMNRSRCVAPDLSGAVDKPPLDGSFQTDMMRFWRVIERRVGVKLWKPALAVVTADYYLHLFDVSSHPDITVGSSPEDAYEKLLPHHEFPTSQETRTDQLLKDLTPTESISLLNCSVLSGGDQVEVTETFSGRWSDKATKKFFFKAYEESDVWEDVLKRRPADEQSYVEDMRIRLPSF